MKSQKVSVWRGVSVGILLLACAAAYGQETPAPPLAVPVATNPPANARFLPQATLTGENLTLRGETLPDGTFRQIAEGRPIFRLGDLRVEADRIIWDRPLDQSNRIEATGNVRIQRGDESLTGAAFHFDSAADTLNADKALILSPPFSVQADSLTRTGGEAVLTRPRFGIGAGSEFGLFAEQATLQKASGATPQKAAGEGSARFHNVTLTVFGAHLLTVKRLTIPLRESQSQRGASAGIGSLFVLRNTPISGLSVSAGLPFTVTGGVYGNAQAALTVKAGIQPAVTIRHDFLSPLPQTIRPVFSLPGALAPEVAGDSPIRQLITARPVPLAYDPILDYRDILPESNPFTRPSPSLSRDAYIAVNATYNQESGGSRFGPLLFSHLPEITAAVRVPLASPIPAADNAAALRYLRTPRLVVRGETHFGHYREAQWDQPGRPSVSATRSDVSAGLGVAPYLIGSRFLLTGDASAQQFFYSGGNRYRIFAASVAAQYVFAARTALGVGYTRRNPYGEADFLSNRVDTRSEAQFRAQYTFPRAGLTFSGLARYDTEQGKVFDYQFAIALRRGIIEPRAAYRTLNRQISFLLAFPGLAER